MNVCTVESCSKRLRARGVCSTHYNRMYAKQRHAVKATVECAGCGKTCEKRPDPRRPRQFCSLQCRTNDQYREVREARPGTDLVHVGPAWPRCDLPDRHPATNSSPRRKPRVFVSGPCSWCRAVFTIVDQLAARYCSKRCLQAAHRDCSGRFRIPDSVRFGVYKRDGWVCQLCLEPVDGDLPVTDIWSATLDHIICQSWTDEPDHSPSNLRLAHRWCNSVRGDEGFARAQARRVSNFRAGRDARSAIPVGGRDACSTETQSCPPQQIHDQGDPDRGA